MTLCLTIIIILYNVGPGLNVKWAQHLWSWALIATHDQEIFTSFFFNCIPLRYIYILYTEKILIKINLFFI